MAGAKCIMLALFTVQEATETIIEAQFRKAFIISASEQLVYVALVGYIEDKAVRRGIEDAVQANREFHNTQIRSDVAAIPCRGFNDQFTNLSCQISELFERQVLNVLGGLYFL